MTDERFERITEYFREKYPSPKPALEYGSVYQLLVAVILSAQCTDARVNLVTKELFKNYGTPQEMLKLNADELGKMIFSCGLYKSKAEHILSASRDICEKFGGNVPENYDDLLSLAGVGRKTANLVVGDIYGKPAVVADTHFIRLCNRLGFVNTENPEAVEREMRKLLPPERSNDFCHRAVLLGREICTARKALCNDCPLNEICYKHINIKPVKKSKGKGKK